MSLRIQDDLHLKYCSDTFGFYPFLPQLSWKVFTTPQIPSTLPPIEVILKRASEEEAREGFEELADSVGEGLNVLPLNAAVANDNAICPPLYEFLLRMRENGAKFMSLGNIARSIDKESLDNLRKSLRHVERGCDARHRLTSCDFIMKYVPLRI
jgi:hypothetical protein